MSINVLALGDSYTVGESLSWGESFPGQLERLLLASSSCFDEVNVRVVAKTGWTTDELIKGIEEASPSLASCYDAVTLLIGVNNQYRGLSTSSYAGEFESLLKRAIAYAGNDPRRVIVLSIPDWGVTPFAIAQSRNRVDISRQIDEFNAENMSLARRFNVEYIEVTVWTREGATDNSLLAEDGLHPSGREYSRWAAAVGEKISTTGVYKKESVT